MLLGLLCGILMNFSIESIVIGELFYIGLWIISYLKFKKIYINKTILIFMILIYVFIIYNLSYFFFDIIEYSGIIKNSFKYSLIVLLTFISFQHLKRNKCAFYKFFIFLIIGNILFSYFSSNYNSIFDYRFWHIQPYGLIFLLLLQSNKFLGKKYLILFLGMIFSIYAKSRTHQVIFAVCILYTIFNSLRKLPRNPINVLKIFFVFLITLGGFWCISLEFLYSLQTPTASNMERTLLLNSGMEIINKNFWSGVGPGNFAIYCRKMFGLSIPTNMSVHNYFLEVFIEWGIIGALMIITPYFLLFKKIKINNELENYLFIYLLITLFFNVISGEFKIYYSMLLACSLFVSSKDFIEFKLYR